MMLCSKSLHVTEEKASQFEGRHMNEREFDILMTAICDFDNGNIYEAEEGLLIIMTPEQASDCVGLLDLIIPEED